MLLACAHLRIGPLAWTGDEPLYTQQGAALLTHSAVHLSRSLVPTLIGAFSAPSIEPGRWLTFALGCAGLVWLLAILKRTFNPGVAYIATTIIAFSLPLLAYLKLIYPEVPLFLGVCAALGSLRARADLRTILWSLLLPFIYIRALPLAIAFAALAVFRQRGRGEPTGAILRSLGVFTAGIAVFAVYQFAIFGNLNGGVFATYAPAPSIFIERLGMQLFDARHGLVANSPIFLVAFAGLILGSMRRVPACIEASILLGVYVLTFMWSTAVESYPARFWVAGLPLLAIGIAYWFAAVKNAFAFAGVAVLGALTATNTILFVLFPGYFLGNGSGPLSYTLLFQTIPFDFGLVLPIDGHYAAPIPYLLLFAVLLVAALTIPWRIAGPIALVLALIPFAVCAAGYVPRADYTVERVHNGNEILIRMTAPTPPVFAVQLDFLYRWWAPEAPHELIVRCFDASGHPKQLIEPSRWLLQSLDCSGDIRITGEPAGSFFATKRDIGLIRRLL